MTACPHCGAQLAEEGDFCPFCGAGLTPDMLEQEKPVLPLPDGESEPEEQGSAPSPGETEEALPEEAAALPEGAPEPLTEEEGEEEKALQEPRPILFCP